MSGSAKKPVDELKKKPVSFNPIEAHRLLAELIREQAPGLASHLQPKARAYVDYVLFGAGKDTAEEDSNG